MEAIDFLKTAEAIRTKYKIERTSRLAHLHASRQGLRGNVRWFSTPEPYLHEPELIRSTLPATGVAFIGGQSGAGKTFLAIELAFCVALGLPFAGRQIERPGGVIYLAFEGAGTIAGRVAARRQSLEYPDAVLPFAMVEGFGPVLKPKDYEALGNKVRKIASQMRVKHDGAAPKLVVIDTVAAAGMIAPDSENDPGAWQAIFDGLNPIARDHDLLFILVHHMGKSTEAGLRGSSNARAGADAVLAMTCQRDEITGDTANHNLALTKSRSAPEGSIAAVTLEPVMIGQRDDGSPVMSCVLKFDTATKVVSVQRGRGRKPNRGRVALKNALDDAIQAHGVDQRVHGKAGSPAIRAVAYDNVVEAFEKFYATGKQAGDPKRHDALRMALRRAVDACPEVAQGHWESNDWVWLPKGWSDE